MLTEIDFTVYSEIPFFFFYSTTEELEYIKLYNNIYII